MSRASDKLASIRRHVPRTRRLPEHFGAFAKLVVSARGPRHDLVNLTWTDARSLLNADRRALDTLLPFLRLGDGGVVALWWHADGEPCVMQCDSEGQYGVLATSFPDFLLMLARPKPDFAEKLELDAAIDSSALVPPTRRPRAVPTALTRKLKAWVDSHSLSATPDDSKHARRLAQRLVAIARHMLKDGRSKVHRLRDFHWTIELRIRRSASGWDSTYLDYGKWLPLPAKYGLQPLVPEVVRHLKNQRVRRFELSIWKDGHVFVDGGNQLTIEPGG